MLEAKFGNDCVAGTMIFFGGWGGGGIARLYLLFDFGFCLRDYRAHQMLYKLLTFLSCCLVC